MADSLQIPNQQITMPGDTPALPDKTDADQLPAKVAVKTIDNKSDDWQKYHVAWDLMYFLYVGGVEIEAIAEQFLKKRAKELSDVYQSRIERFNYENHVGTAIDWYLSALFETPPEVETAAEDADIKKTTAANKSPLTPAGADAYYDALEQNCDRAGTPLLEFFRTYFKNLLIYGRAAALVDLPPKGEFPNAEEERKAGQFDPYLIQYDPRQVINFSKDKNGALEWIVCSARETRMSSPFEKPSLVDVWYYFDKKQFGRYEREIPEGERSAPDDAMAELKMSGAHALADYNVVPVLYIEIPKGLWLMNRAYSVAKEHLNTDKALSWALYMAAMCMPVIQADGTFEITLSEAAFIQIPANAKYSWSEPEGKCWVHLANRVDTLREEIWRSFYLISQDRTNAATPAADSGVSKQQDMAPSKKVLNLFGDVMRAAIQEIYDRVSMAREDGYEWDVRGLNFPEGPPDAVIDLVAGAMALDIPSDDFEKELYKKAVMAALPDMNPVKKARIFEQIEAAPNQQTRQLMQEQQRGNIMAQRVSTVQAKDVFPNNSI